MRDKRPILRRDAPGAPAVGPHAPLRRHVAALAKGESQRALPPLDMADPETVEILLGGLGKVLSRGPCLDRLGQAQVLRERVVEALRGCLAYSSDHRRRALAALATQGPLPPQVQAEVESAVRADPSPPNLESLRLLLGSERMAAWLLDRRPGLAALRLLRDLPLPEDALSRLRTLLPSGTLDPEEARALGEAVGRLTGRAPEEVTEWLQHLPPAAVDGLLASGAPLSGILQAVELLPRASHLAHALQDAEPADLEVLVERLRNGKPEARRAAVRVLASWPVDPPTAPLLGALEDPDPDVAAEAARLLCRLAPVPAEPLARAVHRLDGRGRQAAQAALERSGGPRLWEPPEPPGRSPQWSFRLPPGARRAFLFGGQVWVLAEGALHLAGSSEAFQLPFPGDWRAAVPLDPVTMLLVVRDDLGWVPVAGRLGGGRMAWRVFEDSHMCDPDETRYRVQAGRLTFEYYVDLPPSRESADEFESFWVTQELDLAAGALVRTDRTYFMKEDSDGSRPLGWGLAATATPLPFAVHGPHVTSGREFRGTRLRVRLERTPPPDPDPDLFTCTAGERHVLLVERLEPGWSGVHVWEVDPPRRVAKRSSW